LCASGFTETASEAESAGAELTGADWAGPGADFVCGYAEKTAAPKNSHSPTSGHADLRRE
jgi:hypothetical protein